MKNHYLFLLSLLLGVINAFSVHAQEANLSLYQHTPFLTNPGMVGVMTTPSIMVHHRHQTVEAGTQYTTSMVSGYYPLSAGNHRIGLGVTALNEPITDFMTTRGGMLSVAYGVQLSPKHTLSLGTQAGYFDRGMSSFSYTTDLQFRGGVFQPDAPTGEPMPSGSRSFLTLTTGLFWQMQDHMGRTKAYVGGALFNYNRPEVGIEDDYSLPASFRGTAGWQLYAGPQLSVEPNARWIAQSGYHMFTTGSWLRYDLNAGKTHTERVSIGAWYNSTRSGVVAAEYQNKKIVAALSYDIPLTDELNTVRHGGIFELMFAFRFQNNRTSRSKKRSKQSAVNQKKGGKTETILPSLISPKAASEESVDQPNLAPTRPIRPVAPVTTKENRSLTPEEQELLARVVRFELGSSQLDDESERFLAEITELLQRKTWLSVRLTGHTCNVGDASVNQRISQQRATVVHDYLVKQGISSDRILVQGKGETVPLTTNTTVAGRRQNRRVRLPGYGVTFTYTTLKCILTVWYVFKNSFDFKCVKDQKRQKRGY